MMSTRCFKMTTWRNSATLPVSIQSFKTAGKSQRKEYFEVASLKLYLGTVARRFPTKRLEWRNNIKLSTRNGFAKACSVVKSFTPS